MRPLTYRHLELSSPCVPRVLVYALPSLLLSLAINIPRLLELELVTSFTDARNITHEVTAVTLTPMRTNPDYITYYLHWTRYNKRIVNVRIFIMQCRFLLTVFLPFLLLLVLNMLIYSAMKRQKNISNRDQSSSILLVIGNVLITSLKAIIP